MSRLLPKSHTVKLPRYSFRAHFNRINMQRGNPNVWTVHTKNTCYQVQEIEFRCPVKTVYKANGRQPRAVLIGRAHLEIRGGFITPLKAILT